MFTIYDSPSVLLQTFIEIMVHVGGVRHVAVVGGDGDIQPLVTDSLDAVKSLAESVVSSFGFSINKSHKSVTTRAEPRASLIMNQK